MFFTVNRTDPAADKAVDMGNHNYSEGVVIYLHNSSSLLQHRAWGSLVWVSTSGNLFDEYSS